MTITIELNDLANLQNENTAVTQINQNSETIEGAFNTALNTAGDQMLGTLDMNSNNIINLPNPVSANSPLRLQDLNNFTGGGGINTVPSGGNTGDALVKKSNTSYDLAWSADPADITSGTNIVMSGTNPVVVSTVTSPTFNHLTATTITVTTINCSSITAPLLNVSTEVNAGAYYLLSSSGVVDGSIAEGLGGAVFFTAGTVNEVDICDHSQNPIATFQGVGNAGPYFVVNGGTTAAITNIQILSTLDATSSQSGAALSISGGLAVSKNFFVGSSVNASTVNATTINATTVNVGTLTVTGNLTATGNITGATGNITSITTTSPLVFPRYTVTTINAVSSPATGMVAMVTDALGPTLGGSLTGGGTAKVLALYSGTAWEAV